MGYMGRTARLASKRNRAACWCAARLPFQLVTVVAALSVSTLIVMMMTNTAAGAVMNQGGNPANAIAAPKYQTPGAYRKINYTGVPKLSGCGFNLKPNMTGLKTRMVADRLKVHQPYQTMTPLLISKIKEFQKSKKIPANGVVDRRTWLALGFAGSDFTAIDCYQHPLRITPEMSRAQIVEAFVATALEYDGSPYIWGGANKPTQGADCSGLVIQALNSIGIDPQPFTTVSHAHPDIPTTRQMYADTGFMHVPLAEVERGDLLFYKGTTAKIRHVGVYLGNEKIMELVDSGGRVSGWKSPGGIMPEAVRPIP